MDVFLGVYSPAPGRPNIWDIESDLHLHNSAPRAPPCAPHGAPHGAPRTTPHGAPQTAHESASANEMGAPSTPSHRAGAARRHALFDEFYSPTRFTSFDELLSRPFVAPMPQPARAKSTQPASGSGGGGGGSGVAAAGTSRADVAGEDDAPVPPPWAPATSLPDEITPSAVGGVNVFLPRRETHHDDGDGTDPHLPNEARSDAEPASIAHACFLCCAPVLTSRRTCGSVSAGARACERPR